MFWFLGRTADVGLYVTGQLAELPVTERVHAVGVKVPVSLVENVAVPVGALGVPRELSVMVAVQEVVVSLATGFGLHVTLVVVVLLLTVMLLNVSLLPECVLSPA